MTILAEFRRRSALQRRAAKLLGARRRGKKRSAWKGIALAGGAAAVLATVALGRRKKGGAVVAATPGSPPPRSLTPAPANKQIGGTQASNVLPASKNAPLDIPVATPKPPALIGKTSPTALPPVANTPAPNRRKQNSERTKRRLAYLAETTGKGSTGKYKSIDSMMNDYRGKRPKSKKGANYDRYRTAEQKRRTERRSRIDAARKRNANYSLTKTALAHFARSNRW